MLQKESFLNKNSWQTYKQSHEQKHTPTLYHCCCNSRHHHHHQQHDYLLFLLLLSLLLLQFLLFVSSICHRLARKFAIRYFACHTVVNWHLNLTCLLLVSWDFFIELLLFYYLLRRQQQQRQRRLRRQLLLLFTSALCWLTLRGKNVGSVGRLVGRWIACLCVRSLYTRGLALGARW